MSGREMLLLCAGYLAGALSAIVGILLGLRLERSPER